MSQKKWTTPVQLALFFSCFLGVYGPAKAADTGSREGMTARPTSQAPMIEERGGEAPIRPFVEGADHPGQKEDGQGHPQMPPPRCPPPTLNNPDPGCRPPPPPHGHDGMPPPPDGQNGMSEGAMPQNASRGQERMSGPAGGQGGMMKPSGGNQ